MAFTGDHARPFLEALSGLAPLLAARRTDFDRDRCLTPDVFAALADARLFRLWLPKTLGGPELSPFDFMRVVEAAAALDGSIGWLVGNGGGMSRVGGYLPSEVTSAWFADPRAFIVSSTGAVGTAVPVSGGYRVTGRWPFGSGAPHATIFMGLASIKGETPGEQPALCCHFPRNAVVLHDNWHVSGLRASGSFDFEVREAFVPTSHVHPLLDHPPAQSGLVYRLPPLSTYPWTVALVPLGIAAGAIDSFVALAARKTRQGTAASLRDRETVQASIGRASALVAAGRAFLISAMSELVAALDAGGDRLTEARLSLRVACSHAADSALRVVDILEAEAGTAAIFETSPIERAGRDVRAAAKHVAMGPHVYLANGRRKLGLDTGTLRF